MIFITMEVQSCPPLTFRRHQCINAIKGMFDFTALGTSQVTRPPGPGPGMVKVK